MEQKNIFIYILFYLQTFIQYFVNIFCMNIENKQGMNDVVGVDAEPNLNRNDQSFPEVVEMSRNPTVNSIQPQQQYFEVIQRRQQQFGDDADFSRILNMIKNKQKQHASTTPAGDQHKNNLKKKQSQKKQQEEAKILKRQQQQKKQRILKLIEPHMKNYKTLNNANSGDTQVTKLRSESRQKIFKFLMYGIQELKLLKQDQLNIQQKRITKLTLKDPYLLAKSLTTQIDVQFLKNLNMDNKQTVSKRYKSFIKSLTSNIAQDTNLQLRRKILTKQFTGKKLSAMKEEDFYPPQIRERIIQRQNLLLRQAAAQEKPLNTFTQQVDFYVEPVVTPVVEKKQEEKKPKYKYLEQSSILMLRDLLKPQQIIKMRNLLQFDNRKDIQEKLVGNITKVFDNVI